MFVGSTAHVDQTVFRTGGILDVDNHLLLGGLT